MKNRRIDYIIAIALAGTAGAQGLWLGLWAPDGTRLQWLLVAGFVTLASHQAWLARRRLLAHFDMLLLMGGFGGLGMMIGGWIDMGFPASAAAVTHQHHHQMGLVSWMTGLMLLFAVPPGVAFSRCIAPVRRSPAVIPAVAIDVLGMLLGMFAAHTFWAMPLAHAIGSHFAGMHLAMLAGMLGGMIPAMLLRDLLLRYIEFRDARTSQPSGQG